MDDNDLNSDYNDHPPTLSSNISFWLGQILFWLAYALVSLIFIPWAIAMHLVIGVLAIPLFPLCCWQGGRKVFLYAYVLTVMLPGKFLWFNLCRSIRRRGLVWDFEMGKPQPIPLQNRRRLSETPDAKSQECSQFLTKLPPEIRLRIYHHVFVGDSAFINIVQSKSDELKVGAKKAKGPIQVRGYPCRETDRGIDHDQLNRRCPVHNFFPNPRGKSGALALVQTCKQVYAEAINLLYSLPTFNLNALHQPPFFHRSVLPNRLAQIRSLHLVYDQNHMSKVRHTARSTARYHHRVGQCTFCNVNHWLSAIKKYMTGLRSVEMYIFLEKKHQMVSLGEPWIIKLFALQFGRNGQRDFQIHVFPKGEVSELSTDAAWVLKVRMLDKQLQQKIVTEVELHRTMKLLREKLARVREREARKGEGDVGSSTSKAIKRMSRTEDSWARELELMPLEGAHFANERIESAAE